MRYGRYLVRFNNGIGGVFCLLAGKAENWARKEGRCRQSSCDSSRAVLVSSDIDVPDQRTKATPSCVKDKAIGYL